MPPEDKPRAGAAFVVGLVVGLVVGATLVTGTGCSDDVDAAPSCDLVDAGPGCSSVCLRRVDLHCDDVGACYCDTSDGPVCCRGDL